jgi:hypothetical protein
MRGPSPIKLTREELYERVWQETMIALAPKLGMTDRGLSKLCDRYKIPYPPQGYWLQKDQSRKPKRPPLPAWRDPQFISPPPIEFPGPAAPEPSSISRQRSYEAKHPIVVADNLTSPDPLVRDARRLLVETGFHGVLRPSEPRCLDISVTKESLGRALRTFNAFLRATRVRGWLVTVQVKPPFLTQVAVLGELIAVQIVERLHHKRGTSVYTPSGVLAIRLTHSPPFSSNAWARVDGKMQPIEARLNEVMVGLVELAEDEKECHRQREQREREQLERQRQRAAEAERQAREEDRQAELKRQVDSWIRADNTRAYLAVLREAAASHVQREPDGRLARWIRWAESHVESTDPLRDVSALPLDPEGYGRRPIELERFRLKPTSETETLR